MVQVTQGRFEELFRQVESYTIAAKDQNKDEGAPKVIPGDTVKSWKWTEIDRDLESDFRAAKRSYKLAMSDDFDTTAGLGCLRGLGTKLNSAMGQGASPQIVSVVGDFMSKSLSTLGLSFPRSSEALWESISSDAASILTLTLTLIGEYFF